ncbi:protein-export chaperone SecB [Alloalcanivorax xenomutans]|uniref:Protein-export protein SecB n=1 Tax=Alloalcanivorax xenomutans TaxID=1094342 RepID=A0A9Q3WAB4_9GAMM|nr:protein-export chaperone SecB [Alloalcanivorax xenomutans]ERS10133.1 preprotein translocase subunit SecB [Alcanivorax sp. PN-3]KYZ86570.1 preprotein translocase subunit SecB [Alcanivorax sp. KX64203]MBA4720066.1 protein-export chaperone SecB [Alcanivorax sp.]ARB44483.1 preprotein translocase subunit SecB [Alloalcanivorax xenomutans]MCE7511197.1 protein-export chaperone SecB [Alloalcanivorax xenomutans]
MADQQEKVFQLQRVYLKDASFECPGAPEIFLQEWKPKVNVQLNNNARRLGDSNEYEVEVTVTVTAKDEGEEKTFYLVEVKQAGIFTLVGIEGEERNQLLGAYCPNLLFPYVREVVSDLVSKASFPQMVLQPLNFDALYQQQRQQQTEGNESVTVQ